MPIMTSYFSSRAPKDRKVSIAKWPRGFSGPKAPLLAPEDPKAIDWQRAYRADLERRFPTAEALLGYLQEITNTTRDPILCCFEKDPAECHRSILAAYIKEKLDIEVVEWEEPDPQNRLF